MPVRAILFDMDGLMFDTERLARDAWRQVSRETGYTIGEEILARIRGAAPALAEKVFREALGPTFSYSRARARRVELVEERIRRSGLPAKPGLHPLLEQLRRRGIPAAVASSSSRTTVLWYLELSGTGHFFSALVSGEDVAHSKPAPDIFQKAAQRLACPPEHCLVLEDSANGLLAARRAGMRALCIPDIALPPASVLETCDAVLPSLDQVVPWLEEHHLL